MSANSISPWMQSTGTWGNMSMQQGKIGLGITATAPDSGGTDIRLFSTGTCGDQMRLRVRNTGGIIELDITIPSIDPTEVWNLSAYEQNYGAATGGRIGDPVTLTPTVLPPLAYNAAEGGFVSAGNLANTDNLTHGISYTATRTSPSPTTCTNLGSCTNQGFWTNPSGSGFGPAPENPTGRPNRPPAFTGESEVDSGGNHALLQMDQQMLDSGPGIPATNRFILNVNGLARTVTAVHIFNDSPPNRALLDLTFDGAAIGTGQTITLQYIRPLTSGSASLRDLESVQTASFGPVTLTVP
jgi:hypothetical protein